MASGNPSAVSARRNRILAIVAGTVTITAVVVAFAAEYFELPWKWLRPSVELLLLAELVGLVVLERHQLFEPVHHKVDAMHTSIGEIQAMITESTRNSGQVTACTSAPEIVRAMARIVREALARDQQAPQILRLARLSGCRARTWSPEEDPDLLAEWQEWRSALSAYTVTPGSAPDGRARRWSVRLLIAFATLDSFNQDLEQNLRSTFAARPSNVEYKVVVRLKPEAIFSPGAITDRDVVTTFDDTIPLRWGLWLQGPQYLPLFTRWFDDLWATIPDSYLIYSRNGFNQSAIDRILKELEAVESTAARRTA